ncbi:MAG: hypothetical protein IKF97_00635 [Clostridia bacterium]|nr:hypothetical protein [Clostridia bacterium]
MPVIITLIIAIFLILISWTWHNLGNIDKTKKVITIIASLIIMYVITLIIFNISKINVDYKSEEEMIAVRNVLVLLFTFINGLIVMPSFGKIINRVKEKEITKEQASKKFLITLAIFIIVLFFECGYLKDTQKGILDIYNQAVKINN